MPRRPPEAPLSGAGSVSPAIGVGRDGPGSSPSATSVSSAAALRTSGHASVAPVPSVLSMPSSSSAEARNRCSALSSPRCAWLRQNTQ